MRKNINVDESKFNFKSNTDYAFKSSPGLNEKIIREISEYKSEPSWMLEKRLEALRAFHNIPEPNFGVDRSQLNINEIIPYIRPNAAKEASWDEVPEEIKNTFERLGIPEAERKSLAGVGAQYDSEVVYQHIREDLEKLGVIFLDMETAVKKYPELVKKYFMRLVPASDHKYAALHGAIWSGGSFVYVPENIRVPLPLQAYFRMNLAGMGQFEHTLIIADKGSELHFIEGCSAPRYNVHNLHAGMVEIYVMEGAKVRYSTIQNWSKNTFNLNTKRAIVEAEGTMEWVSGSLGSMKTMLYPATILNGRGAKANHLAVTYAGAGQMMDTGSKVIHLAPGTSSTVDARSISVGGGWAFYRGLLYISEKAKNSKASVECSALMLDNFSKSDTVPIIDVRTNQSDIGHEARIGRISEDQIYYLMTRGLTEAEAKAMIVRGFMEPISRELPIEYAVELNRLINLEIEKSIG
ncbi:Fe-S cluster assembly protein SufB [Kosmotoga arenicorallina S304]|uniref:Fe-S cluster assembly protein SufB n=1 Tax=Kosmotoga arenicorallina S304 TaxID=1453497 RepID=A0A176K2Y8_9BACT|nr:Fe-S cluster assembly protein SufB [Kosmotoga arenicorallina]OAA31408.1 Fe-S cluster assembly protein SufB [Kosmotoga arenicorallina S304]